MNYINGNGLKKLDTIVDQLESVDFNFSVYEGDTFTINGEFFLEIVSNELDYLNPIDEVTRVLGVRDVKGVSFCDAIFVKSHLRKNEKR